jgi:type II secretory pathway pseudopilin PulG
MRQRSQAFSLVEVTIAIGIFAFVIVGVMGLLPAGMRMRADAAADTRGVLISQELFAAVRAAPSLSNVSLRKGPGQKADDLRRNINLTTKAYVQGYPNQTTVPYFEYKDNPERSWSNADSRDPQVVQSAEQAIDTIARLSATNLGGGLYRVNVEVRAPASIPLTNSRTSLFSTLIYSP